MIKLETLVTDYAIWDDLYSSAVLAFDREWIDLNVGSDSNSVGRDGSLIVDAHMRPIYGSWHEEVRTWDPMVVTNGGIDDLLKRAAGPSYPDKVSGFLKVGDDLAVVAIARIRPYSPSEIFNPPEAERFLIFIDVLDSEDVQALAAMLTWPDLRMSTIESDGPNLAVTGPDGSVVGYVGWAAPSLAAEALRSRSPHLILGFLFTSAALLGLFMRIRKTTQRLVTAEAAARLQANTDALTGAANRRALSVEAARLLKSGDQVHALVIDFDGFKGVNDQVGHRAGDALLVEMTHRMRRHLPLDAVLARVGGDEFAILVDCSTEAAMELGYDLVALICAPFDAPGRTVSISASIGVTVAEPEMNPEELIRRADVAMYSAKVARPGLTRLYDAALDAEHKDERDLREDMKAGLERGEFWVSYQPIVGPDGAALGVEALVRWNHPVRGLLSPGMFIPMAERSRFILKLGAFVLRTACRHIVEQQSTLSLSVNLSPVQLNEPDIVEMISGVLAETGMPASQLELEVTEGYLIERADLAIELLGRLRALGVRISLDDFGCGYASLGYLRKFPLDKVKIDRSFVTPLAIDPKALEVFAALVALCRAFDMTITAEGVETEAQANRLREMGCDSFQGFLFGKPDTCLPLRIAEVTSLRRA